MNKINSNHFIFFMLAVSVIGLTSYSSIFIQVGFRNTWISVIVAFLLLALAFKFIISISLKHNIFDIKSIFLKTYPAPISKFLLLLFSLGIFFTSIESSSVEPSSIHTNIFIESPIWYCLLFFIVPASYIAYKNFTSLTIVTTYFTFISIISFILIELISLKYLNYTYIFPILSNGLDINFLKSVLMILGSLSSIFIVLPLLKFVVDTKKLKKAVNIALIFIFLISTLSILLLIMSLGPLRCSNIFYPLFIQAQRVEINGFIECGDLFFIFNNVILWSLKFILSLTALITLYKDRISNKKVFIFFYSFVVAIISFFISKNQFVLFNILHTFQFISLFFLFIIPIITYILYAFKKKLG